MLCPSVMVFFFVPQNSLNPNISRPPSLFLYHTGRLNGEEQRDEEKTKEPGVAGDSSDEYEDIENEGEFGGGKTIGFLTKLSGKDQGFLIVLSVASYIFAVLQYIRCILLLCATMFVFDMLIRGKRKSRFTQEKSQEFNT